MQRIISFPMTLMFLALLAILSFLFSAVETSIIGLSRIRLRHMISQGLKRAQSIQRLMSKLDKFITAILIGNNFVNIAMSALITGLFVRILGYNWGVIISTVVTAIFILIFCEITPKILATKRTEKVALLLAPLMEFLVRILSPFINFFISITNFILKILGVGPARRSPLVTEEELRMMIEIGKEEGILSDEERKMLHRIFEFGDTKIKEVMVPKEEIVAVSTKVTAEELLDIFVEQGHARLPVYEGNIENIVGVIYAHDLLYILRDKGLFVLQDLVHEAFYAPTTMQVNELLRKFQADKIQIAVVVDERKRTVGLVTLEDLMEEIVGEIEEERSNHH